MSNVQTTNRPKKPKRQSGGLRYGTKASRHWMWQLRQQASKWNSALDHNPLWSVGAWLLGAAANTLVFLALKPDISAKIGLNLSTLLNSHLALICLLGVAPLLGGVKKLLKLIEVQDDHARVDLMNRNIANIKRCGVDVCKLYNSWGDFAVNADHEKRIIETVTAYIAIAFADVANREQESLKVVVGRVTNGKLSAVVAIAPSGAPQLSQISELARPETTFSHCIKSKRTVVIPDIALELMKRTSKFKLSSTNLDGGHGSLICYPIIGYNASEVRYVLSIYSDVERSFDPANNKYYELLLSTYAAHILMVA